jgi:hypothetical protein
MFRKPNNASRSTLDAGEVAIGEHRLTVTLELKEAKQVPGNFAPSSHVLDGHKISRFWVLMAVSLSF